MTDIYDAIARGFRYPPRSAGGFWDDDLWEHELDDDYDEVPSAPLALDRAQRTALRQAVDAVLGERGCDGTLRAAEAWARREEVPWEQLRDALDEHGGFCDCEVLSNVLATPG
jgi:hypothetical protein